MSDTIYSNKKRFNTHDPQFRAFCAGLDRVCDKNDEPRVSQKILNGLWFLTPTFRKYWDSKPTRQINDGMVWILAHHGFQEYQAALAMLVWAEKHVRIASTEDWWEKFFAPAWNRPAMWASVEQHRKAKAARLRVQQDNRNQKRRRRERPNNMQLKDQILNLLSTVEMMSMRGIAHKLQAPLKAVQNAVYRMSANGEVTRPCSGHYALVRSTPLPTPSAPQPAPVEAPAEEPCSFVDTRDLGNGVAWREEEGAMGCSMWFGEKDRDDMPTLEPSRLTAEPSWTR